MSCSCSGTPARVTPCNASYSLSMCNYTDFGMDDGEDPIQVTVEAGPVAAESQSRNPVWDKEIKPAHLRFFNEPIEQIPGYRWDQFEVLINACTSRLRLWSPVCVNPVICVCTSGEGVAVIRQKMYVIADSTPTSIEETSNCDTNPG